MHALVDPKKVLRGLGLSDAEVAVYLSMVAGAQGARDVMKATQLKRPTVYYALGSLEKRGLIVKSGKEKQGRLAPAPLVQLRTMAGELVREASELRESVEALVPALDRSRTLADARPSVAFFEGVDAVKMAIMESHYCQGKEILSVAPQNNFFWGVGPEFVERYIDERRRRGIKTRNLWERPIDAETFRNYYAGFSDVRILPSVMRGRFDSSILLYDDAVLIVSSYKDAYCVLITSQEYHDTMQAWFEGLWSASKPHPNR